MITQKQKFINYIMQGGKKHLARNLLEDALTIVRERGNKDPDAIMDKAFENIMPRVEVRPKRIGGAIFQVPGDVLPKRQFFLASKWIKESAQSRKGIPFAQALATELIEASQETGNAFKKKLDVYKNAEANKVNARFARTSNNNNN
ncbi:30S ribosomal protein S7 [Candidatus Gracilibacteria bacterium]|jgi:small subunit ribosomal protein S7|nr:30S ribosomal protein S7 [Candidatus Gracilibacteria bacterium]